MADDDSIDDDGIQSVLLETDAMKAIASSFQGLSKKQIGRVLGWACDRYEKSVTTTLEKPEQHSPAHTPEVTPEEEARWEEFCDLVAEIDLKKDGDRALIAAYWKSQIEDQKVFTGFELNKILEETGHKVGHITNAIKSLHKKKPSLITIQGKKGVNKSYKLTSEGTIAAKKFISGADA